MTRSHDEPQSDRQPRPAIRRPDSGQTSDADTGDDLVQRLQQAIGNAAVGELIRARAKSPPADQGQPLPAQVRQAAEHKLDTDLGDVRLHQGAAAKSYAGSLDAEAVTVGKDVYLGDSDLSSSKARKTILHELAHTAQSTGVAAGPPRAVSSPTNAAEVEARQIASTGLVGEPHAATSTAPAGVAHLSLADDEDEKLQDQSADAPQPSPTAQELLNPAVDESATDQSPKPGTSGDAESVVYEITIMQPLREALTKIQSQDWEEAMAAIQSIGFRLLDYQNTYEKRDPLLYTQLMAARGWLSVVLQHINERLGAKEWTDDQITEHVLDSVGEFQRIGAQIH